MYSAKPNGSITNFPVYKRELARKMEKFELPCFKEVETEINKEKTLLTKFYWKSTRAFFSLSRKVITDVVRKERNHG